MPKEVAETLCSTFLMEGGVPVASTELALAACPVDRRPRCPTRLGDTARARGPTV